MKPCHSCFGECRIVVSTVFQTLCITRQAPELKSEEPMLARNLVGWLRGANYLSIHTRPTAPYSFFAIERYKDATLEQEI